MSRWNTKSPPCKRIGNVCHTSSRVIHRRISNSVRSVLLGESLKSSNQIHLEISSPIFIVPKYVEYTPSTRSLSCKGDVTLSLNLPFDSVPIIRSIVFRYQT